MKFDQDTARAERGSSPGFEENEAAVHLKTAVGRAFPWINAPAASICAVISIFGHRLPIPSTVLDSMPEQSQVLCWFSVSSGLIGCGQKLAGDIDGDGKKRDGTPRTVSLRQAFHDILALKSNVSRALFWVYYPVMMVGGLLAMLGGSVWLPKAIIDGLPTWDTTLSFWLVSLFLVISCFDREDEILMKAQGRTPKHDSMIVVMSKPFHVKRPFARVLFWCNFPLAYLCLNIALMADTLPLPRALLDCLPGFLASLIWMLLSVPLGFIAVLWDENEAFRARALGIFGGLWHE